VNANEYGNNTPTKRSSTSGVWTEVKRLRGTLNNAAGDGTHICMVELKQSAVSGAPAKFCNTVLKLHRTKATPQSGTQTWLTTRAAEHLQSEHPKDSPIGAKFAARAMEREANLMEQQMGFGMPTEEGIVVGTNMATMFRLSKKEKALSSQAQWYVYSTMHISKSEFESVLFKRMLAGGEDSEKVSVLSQVNLKNYVRGEFAVFLMFLKLIFALKYALALGNKFAQALHDGGTLVSHKKYQALALQLIAPDWKKNLVVTIGLKKSSRNTDADVATIWTDIVPARCGLRFEQVVGRMRSDRAAKGVAGELDMQEEEVCEMHDTEKLGRAATGGLVRTRNKVAVNPFPEGVALVQRAHKLGAYFGYSTRSEQLTAVGKVLGDVPDISIKVDYNTTRIAAVHGLLLSEMRLNRGLRQYEIQFNPGWAFTGEDWKHACEFEAVLNCTKVTSTLAQKETGFNGAFTPLIKSLALSKLRANSINLIDMPKITKSPHVPRKEVAIEDLSQMGQTARVRATLEGERRWCGNATEELTGAHVNMGKTELLCTLLDKRTLGCHHITAEQRREAYQIFCDEYVKFFMQADKYHAEEIERKKQEREKQAAAAAAVGGIVGEVVVMAESSDSALKSGHLFQGTAWSDDEVEAGEEQEEVEEVAKEVVALKEAKKALKNWKKYEVDWLDMYPGLKATGKRNHELDLVEDLMNLDMGVLYTHLEKMDTGRQLYGWIPSMACNSVGQLGALSAESYCERVLSCANNVVTKGNTLLSDEEVEMLVVLRMNRDFMAFMREHYGAEAKQTFGQTVVRD